MSGVEVHLSFGPEPITKSDTFNFRISAVQSHANPVLGAIQEDPFTAVESAIDPRAREGNQAL